jgi:hypothetical protein
MPEALQILRDELPNIDVVISSQYSPLVANGLLQGKVDAAFLRHERLRLQQVEQISNPKAFAFEIGRPNRSCLKAHRLRP